MYAELDKIFNNVSKTNYISTKHFADKTAFLLILNYISFSEIFSGQKKGGFCCGSS